MRVSISGTSITGYDDTRVLTDTEVDFPGNPAQYPNFPTGYTVTGTEGSRVLNQPAFGLNSAQVVAVELPLTYTSPDQATQAGEQPLDPDLTAIAALTTTAFGRGLLDDATAAAVRTTLGLGTAAVTDSTAYVPQSPTLAITYNTDGTVATLTENGVTTTFAYNANGTVNTTTTSGVTQTYSYNADGTISGVA